MIAAISATAAAVVIAGVAIGAGVATGVAVSGHEAAEASKASAKTAAEAQEYDARQKRAETEHTNETLLNSERAWMADNREIINLENARDDIQAAKDEKKEKEKIETGDIQLVFNTDSEDPLGREEYGMPSPAGQYEGSQTQTSV